MFCLLGCWVKSGEVTTSVNNILYLFLLGVSMLYSFDYTHMYIYIYILSIHMGVYAYEPVKELYLFFLRASKTTGQSEQSPRAWVVSK